MGFVTCLLATPFASKGKSTPTTLSSTLTAEQARPIQQLTSIEGRVVFNPQGAFAPTAFPGGRFFLDRRRSEKGCPYGSVFLTPLLPFAKSDRIRTASAIAARPTFFAYIPPSRAKVAEFWLSDDQGNLLYHTTFAPPNQPGVVGIRLPSEVPELKVDRFYEWSLVVSCNPDVPLSSMGVESWVQRRKLPSALETMLNQTPLRDCPAFFARQGLWHDALSTLAQFRLANPQDQRLQDDWSSVLTSVGLELIVQEPLL
jgi:hypothetical protein